MTPWTIWDASESNPNPRKLFQALKIGFIRITCVFLCISFVFLSVTNIQFSSKSWKTKEIQRKIKENTHIFYKIDFESLEQFPRVRIGLRCVPGGVGSHAAQYLRCPLPTNLDQGSYLMPMVEHGPATPSTVMTLYCFPNLFPEREW